MAEQRQGRGDYTLSFEEFIEIIGAIREIPRIYISIEKMETNIQKLTIDQGKAINDLEYRVRLLEQAAQKDSNSSYNGRPKQLSDISQRDLLNLVIRVITLVGSFGSIIYLLVQALVRH